jgi:hypothetical protein
LFSPLLPLREERAGVRWSNVFISNPLTPALSPFGQGEGVGKKSEIGNFVPEF